MAWCKSVFSLIQLCQPPFGGGNSQNVNFGGSSGDFWSWWFALSTWHCSSPSFSTYGCRFGWWDAYIWLYLIQIYPLKKITLIICIILYSHIYIYIYIIIDKSEWAVSVCQVFCFTFFPLVLKENIRCKPTSWFQSSQIIVFSVFFVWSSWILYWGTHFSSDSAGTTYSSLPRTSQARPWAKEISFGVFSSHCTISHGILHGCKAWPYYKDDFRYFPIPSLVI